MPSSPVRRAGKTVVLEWTSPICEFTILKYKSGDVQSLQAKSAADGVVWLQISSAPKSNAAYLEGKSIDALISARGLTIQALLVDSTGSLGHAYGAKATPTVAIVDKSGKLAYWGGFDDSPFGDMGTAPHKYVSEALAAIVANKAPPVARARAYGCGIPYAG